jgi:transcriptional regulator with XRE-family HTH domain
MKKIPGSVNLKLIRELRRAKRLHQKDIAKSIGIATTTYSGWESGARKPDVDKIPMLCKVLGIEPNEFFLNQNNS